ncbi:MAG: DUF2202 domain-containing protein [Methanotrichaceae archaeon]|nr:DUF2202 domain-containing protein [Methanotrichaceae archaeon]
MISEKVLPLAFSFLIALGICCATEDILVVSEDDITLVNESALAAMIDQSSPGVLSSAEKEGLLYMAEEEKLAGDVYLKLYERWNLPVFRNIGNAERTHESAVKTLLQRYALKDPTKEAGAFSNATLQNLYDDLVARGSASLQEALMVGAAIEEIDIKDLKERIDETDKADIRIVYNNLMNGSENHLRAFVRQLSGMGVEYQPQYLSSEEYQGVI